MTHFWYIVFTSTSGRKLCGYYTTGYLRRDTHSMGIVYETEYKPAPGDFDIDTDYRYVDEIAAPVVLKTGSRKKKSKSLPL